MHTHTWLHVYVFADPVFADDFDAAFFDVECRASAPGVVAFMCLVP